MYPTFAKMIAALGFAAAAWYVTGLVFPNLPEGTPTSRLQPVNAAFGFLLGWRIMGRKAGLGYVNALGIGWSCAAAIALTCIFVWAFVEMIERSIDLFYDGPVDAIESGVVLMIDYGSYMIPGPVLPACLIGATIVALVTEWVSHRST